MGILKCENVTRRFGSLAAVDDLSFDVEEGEVFGIAGPNGAGKSTLFNVIAKYYACTSGSIIFENTNTMKLRPDQVCHIGIARTFQIPQLFQTLSVYDNVRVGAHFGNLGRHNEKETIGETIAFIGLKGKENITAANLNLYDKKLTMLAAAMATQPKLLLLDEPISGLSPNEISEFEVLIERINKELGVTVIIIEHLMKVLTKLSGRLMIIDEGRKVAIGIPEQVTQDERVIECYLGSGKHA
jgi:branched-chain amino acid transport system ATP-binding protein